MRLSAFQDAWAAALRPEPPPPAPTPEAAQVERLRQHPGFSVYRNTVLKGCTDALLAQYPTVAQIVGDAWLRAAAWVFVQAHPPSDGRLMAYGAGFADFIDRFAPAQDLPYLGAVARWDRCWTESHLAADATPVSTDWLARQPTEHRGRLRLQPHPAARWSASTEHPAFALWRCHREGQGWSDRHPWQGDAGLLTRPDATVVWQSLSPAGCALLDRCAAGDSLEAAFTAALQTDPAVDIRALWLTLVGAGALCNPHTTHLTGALP